MVTKCDKIDKLHTFWQEPLATSSEKSVKLYMNESSNFQVNHYESPIKFRNTSVTSNSENDLVTSMNGHLQSYIDMEGKKSLEIKTEVKTETEEEAEMKELLVFANENDNDESQSEDVLHKKI